MQHTINSYDKKDRGHHCVDGKHVSIFESGQRSVVLQSRLLKNRSGINGVSGVSWLWAYVEFGRQMVFKTRYPRSCTARVRMRQMSGDDDGSE